MQPKVEKSKGVFPDMPQIHKNESLLWRGGKVVFNFFYETPAMVVGLVAGGVAAHLIFPPAAAACYAMAVASLCSKIVIKLFSGFQMNWLCSLENWALNVKKRVPYIQTAMIICTLVIGYLIPMAGIVSAVVVGGYNGMIFENEYCKYLQHLHKEFLEDKNNDSRELLTLLV